MREIKFRVWNPKSEQMYLSSTINIFTGIQMPSKECFEYWETGSLMSEVSVELMQYAGFKDKNGVEIYEGDLVNTYHPKDCASTMSGILRFEKCIITFHAGCFCVKQPVMGSSYTNFPIFMEGVDNIEVVGNIYEK